MNSPPGLSSSSAAARMNSAPIGCARCSRPVLQFENQEAALATAEAAIAALFDENLDHAPEPEAQPAPPKKEAAQVSRRTLFLGRKAARP